MLNSSASEDSSPATDLHRIAYRCRVSGYIVKTEGIHRFEICQQLLKTLNVQYGEEYEYFAEAVNLCSLTEKQLLRLVNEGKLTVNEISRYVRPKVLKEAYKQ